MKALPFLGSQKAKEVQDHFIKNEERKKGKKGKKEKKRMKKGKRKKNNYISCGFFFLPMATVKTAQIVLISSVYYPIHELSVLSHVWSR